MKAKNESQRRSFVLALLWAVTLGGAYFVGLQQLQPAHVHLALSTMIDAKPVRESSENPQSSARLVEGAVRSTPRVEEILSLKDPLERLRRFSEMVRGLDRDGLKSCLIEFRKIPPSGKRDALLKLLLTRMGAVAPELGFTFAQQLRRGDERLELEGAVLAGMAKVDALGALKWIRENPETRRFPRPGLDSQRQFQVVVAVAEGEHFELFPQILGMFTDQVPVAKSIVQEMAQTWFQSSPEDALKWVATLPRGEIYDSAFSEVAYELSRTDPLAAEALARATDSEKAKASALERAVVGWLNSEDRKSAREVIARNAPSPAADEAISVFVRTGLRDDFEASTNAMNAFSNEKRKQQELAGAVRYFGEDRARDAANWVIAFSNEVTRADLLSKTMTNWARKDPAAARTFIQTEPRLTAPEREALLAKVGK